MTRGGVLRDMRWRCLEGAISALVALSGLNCLATAGSTHPSAAAQRSSRRVTVDPSSGEPAESRSKAGGEPAGGASDTCSQLPFFAHYSEHGRVLRQTAAEIVVRLDINLHALDCSAPDGYGHETTLTLRIEPHGAACVVRTATATSTPWGDAPEPSAPVGPTSNRPWNNTFVVVGQPDLAAPALTRVQLYDADRRHAIILLPNQYWFFEYVDPDSKLVEALEPDSDICAACVYGYTFGDNSGMGLGVFGL